MTLAGNSLSCGDVRKACRRYADEFLRDPKEHDGHKSHAVHVSQAKEATAATEEQGGDTDVETALPALNEDNDADLKKKKNLTYKESRLLRDEQRVNRGYRPVTERSSGGTPHRVEGRLDIKGLISRTRCCTCREKDTGHAQARTKENKCQEMAKKQKHHSL